jgi:hypothetical protein
MPGVTAVTGDTDAAQVVRCSTVVLLDLVPPIPTVQPTARNARGRARKIGQHADHT